MSVSQGFTKNPNQPSPRGQEWNRLTYTLM